MDTRRNAIRFPLELPALLRWEEGGETRLLHTQTKNMSSSGLYLMVSSDNQPHTQIDFEVQLPAEGEGTSGVLLRGKARLVRREELDQERVGIAGIIDHYEFSSQSAVGEEPSEL